MAHAGCRIARYTPKGTSLVVHVPDFHPGGSIVDAAHAIENNLDGRMDGFAIVAWNNAGDSVCNIWTGGIQSGIPRLLVPAFVGARIAHHITMTAFDEANA